jgi:hypothetical protein
MTTAEAKRTHQRQVLALLLAVGALVLPTSGAVTYLAVFGGDEAGAPWWAPFAGAGNASDLMGPLLLVGALALGVVAVRGRSIDHVVSAPVIGTVVVVAALTQAVAFGVGGYVVGFDQAFATPDEAAWEIASWTAVARSAAQAASCLAAAAFALRWMSTEQRRTTT